MFGEGVDIQDVGLATPEVTSVRRLPPQHDAGGSHRNAISFRQPATEFSRCQGLAHVRPGGLAERLQVILVREEAGVPAHGKTKFRHDVGVTRPSFPNAIRHPA